jgi:hypothetical protein
MQRQTPLKAGRHRIDSAGFYAPQGGIVSADKSGRIGKRITATDAALPPDILSMVAQTLATEWTDEASGDTTHSAIDPTAPRPRRRWRLWGR